MLSLIAEQHTMHPARAELSRLRADKINYPNARPLLKIYEARTSVPSFRLLARHRLQTLPQ